MSRTRPTIIMSKPVKIQPKGFQDWRDKFRAWGRKGGQKSVAMMTEEKKEWCRTKLQEMGNAARKKKRKKLSPKPA